MNSRAARNVLLPGAAAISAGRSRLLCWRAVTASPSSRATATSLQHRVVADMAEAGHAGQAPGGAALERALAGAVDRGGGRRGRGRAPHWGAGRPAPHPLEPPSANPQPGRPGAGGRRRGRAPRRAGAGVGATVDGRDPRRRRREPDRRRHARVRVGLPQMVQVALARERAAEEATAERVRRTVVARPGIAIGGADDPAACGR